MRSRRRGLSFLDVTVAIVLLGTLTVVAVQILGLVSAQRKAIERREAALLEAANAVEQIMALPWADVTAQRVAEVKLSPETAHILPSGQLTATLTEPADDASARRIAVEIQWADRAGGHEAPVRLVVWRYGDARSSTP